MGSGPNMATTQAQVKCVHCGETVHNDCTWRQGRCPHRQSFLEQTLADSYRSRFYNLIQAIKKLL